MSERQQQQQQQQARPSTPPSVAAAASSLLSSSSSEKDKEANRDSYFTVHRRAVKTRVVAEGGAEIARWIESVTSQPLPPPGMNDLYETLRSGVVLCQVANALKPGSVPHINQGRSPFAAVDNVTAFLRVAESLGVRKMLLFTPNDLLQKSGDFLKVFATLDELIKIQGASDRTPKYESMADLTRRLSVTIPVKKDDEAKQPMPSGAAGATATTTSSTTTSGSAGVVRANSIAAPGFSRRSESKDTDSNNSGNRSVSLTVTSESGASREIEVAGNETKGQRKTRSRSNSFEARDKKSNDAAPSQPPSEGVSAAKEDFLTIPSKGERGNRSRSNSQSKRDDKPTDASASKSASKGKKEKEDKEDAGGKKPKDEREGSPDKARKSPRHKAKKEHREGSRPKKSQQQQQQQQQPFEDVGEADAISLQAGESNSDVETASQTSDTTPRKLSASDDLLEYLESQPARKPSRRKHRSKEDSLSPSVEVERKPKKNYAAQDDDDEVRVYDVENTITSPVHSKEELEREELFMDIVDTSKDPGTPKAQSIVNIPPRPVHFPDDFRQSEFPMKMNVVLGFDGREDDELTLRVGDNVNVIGIPSDPELLWRKGRCNEKTGWFPTECAEAVKRDWVGKYRTVNRQALRNTSALENLAMLADLTPAGDLASFSKATIESLSTLPETPLTDSDVDDGYGSIRSNVSRNSSLKSNSSDKRKSMNLRPIIAGNGTGTLKTMWRDTVSDVLFNQMTEKERKRQEAIHELMQTEAEYEHDLQIIEQVFIEGIRQRKLFTEKEERVLFSNIEQLRPIHEELVQSLHKMKSKSPNIESVGDDVSRLIPYFKMYSVYCSNHFAAVNLYQQVHNDSSRGKNLKKFEEECFKNPACRMMDMQSFLLKPVQRLCRYPLLLKEILKYTLPDHSDYPKLQTALESVELVVAKVNEEARSRADQQKIVDLQLRISDKNINLLGVKRHLLERKILLEDSVLISDLEGKRKSIADASRMLVLFTDMILLGREKDHKIDVVILGNLTDVMFTDVTPESAGSLVKLSRRKQSEETVWNVKGNLPFLTLSFASDSSKTQFLSLVGKLSKNENDSSNVKNDGKDPGASIEDGDSTMEWLRLKEVDLRSDLNLSFDKSNFTISDASISELVRRSGDVQKFRGFRAASSYLYVIDIRMRDDFAYFIYKSYDDFVALHRQVSAAFPSWDLPPVPPSSNSFVSFQQALRRSRDLDVYVKKIINLPQNRKIQEILAAFFTSDGDPRILSPTRSRKEGFVEASQNKARQKAIRSASFEDLLMSDDTLRFFLSPDSETTDSEPPAEETEESRESM